MNKIISVLLMFLMNGSCTPKKGLSQVNKRMNAEYIQAKSFFKPSFVNHFPDSVNESHVGYLIDTNATADHIRFMLYEYDKENVIDSLMKGYIKQSVARYEAGKNCLLVVNRFTNEENRHLRYKGDYVDENLISRSCYDKLYPVPNFWDSEYKDVHTESRLPEDFEIIVLEAKSGKFWDDRHLTDGKYMPEKWKNGYSKGVSISKKRATIIYWFIIW